MFVGPRIQKIKQHIISGDFEKFKSSLNEFSKLDFRIPYTENAPESKEKLYPLLHFTLLFKRFEWLNYLVQKGIPLEQRVEEKDSSPREGSTILPYIQRDEDLLLFLKNGLAWHVYAGNQYPHLAIHQAALYGWSESIEWLLQNKEHVDLKNKEGRTPLQVLISTSPPFFNNLKDKKIFHTQKLKALSLLLKHNAKMDFIEDGNSILHLAGHYFPAAIPSLIKAGTDPYIPNDKGQSILEQLKQSISNPENHSKNADVYLAYLYVHSYYIKDKKSTPSLISHKRFF